MSCVLGIWGEYQQMVHIFIFGFCMYRLKSDSVRSYGTNIYKIHFFVGKSKPNVLISNF